MFHSHVVTGRQEYRGKSSHFSNRPLINTIFQTNFCPTWHYQVWLVLSVSNISLPVLLKFDMSSWSTSYLRFKSFKRPIYMYSQTSILCHLATMPPSLLYHFWSSPTKFNRKYIYYATTYPRYYATWGTVLQCINETINATNETIKRLWNGKSIQYVHVSCSLNCNILTSFMVDSWEAMSTSTGS